MHNNRIAMIKKICRIFAVLGIVIVCHADQSSLASFDDGDLSQIIIERVEAGDKFTIQELRGLASSFSRLPPEVGEEMQQRILDMFPSLTSGQVSVVAQIFISLNWSWEALGVRHIANVPRHQPEEFYAILRDENRPPYIVFEYGFSRLEMNFSPHVYQIYDALLEIPDDAPLLDHFLMSGEGMLYSLERETFDDVRVGYQVLAALTALTEEFPHSLSRAPLEYLKSITLLRIFGLDSLDNLQSNLPSDARNEAYHLEKAAEFFENSRLFIERNEIDSAYLLLNDLVIYEVISRTMLGELNTGTERGYQYTSSVEELISGLRVPEEQEFNSPLDQVWIGSFFPYLSVQRNEYLNPSQLAGWINEYIDSVSDNGAQPITIEYGPFHPSVREYIDHLDNFENRDYFVIFRSGTQIEMQEEEVSVSQVLEDVFDREFDLEIVNLSHQRDVFSLRYAVALSYNDAQALRRRAVEAGLGQHVWIWRPRVLTN